MSLTMLSNSRVLNSDSNSLVQSIHSVLIQDDKKIEKQSNISSSFFIILVYS